MTDRALTPTSYLVLGLVRHLQPCTSYDMKQLVNVSIGMFWAFPHSQLYAEPGRLADEGLLEEEQETSSRRRRLYRLTAEGAEVLEAWLAEPEADLGELRDIGLLKLFFSGPSTHETISRIAEARRDAHLARVEFLTALRGDVSDRADDAQLATLELGLRWDRTAADFWAEVAKGDIPTRR